MKTNWKKISRSMCEMHNEFGISFIDKKADNAAREQSRFVNLSKDKTYLPFNGPKITAKKIRSFLWDNRTDSRFKDEDAIFWSIYHEPQNLSIVGIASRNTDDLSEDAVLIDLKTI